MQLGLTEPLSTLVSRRFTTAKEAGHLIFSATHLSIIATAGIPVSHHDQHPNKTPTAPTSKLTLFL